MPWDKVALVAAALVVVGGLAVLFWPRIRHGAIYPGGSMPADKADPSLYGLKDGEQVWLETDDSVRVHAWWVPANAGTGPANAGTGGAASARGTVLYCHGNAETMATRAWIADGLAKRGFHVLLFDYRGYGLSEGRASEEGLARDVRAAWRHVVDQRGEDPGRVVLMGHSLGSAVATRLALELQAGQVSGPSDGPPSDDDFTPAALVVGSPFPDMPTLFKHHAPWLPAWALRWDTERLAAGSRLGEVDAPTLVLVGEDDQTIPPEISRRVYEAARDARNASGPPDTDPAPITLTPVPANHGALMGHPDVWDALERFFDRVLSG